MQVARSVAEMKKLRRECAGSVGLVPTMGYLHEGHLQLAMRAKSENVVAVATIFVNPTQFGPGEDFKSYPRDLDRDLSLLEKAGAGIVFVPSDKEMYPAHYDTWVEVRGITAKLEGKSRPTHFQGVTTVCNKLFNIIQPDRAYFGQKDAQQVIVIQKMVSDLNMNLEVIVCPTVRESDGLAMSSRNTYLNREERVSAVVLYKSLCMANDMYDRGERDAAKIRRAMHDLISGEPAARIDYISIADSVTLDEADIIGGRVLVSLAVRIGKPRLIDNIFLG
jgi:pantoate--beta-alanine ligase